MQNYWAGDLIGMGILIAYYLVFCAVLPTLLKVWVGVPSEWVRKLQHVAYAMSVFLLLTLFSAWYTAILAAFMLVLLGYPFLLWVERSPNFLKFFAARSAHGGEMRRQLMYVQLSFGLLIFIFWGVLGTSWQSIVAVAVMGWGLGDAAAALVGKAFGRRRFIHSLIEGAKTREGTLAMIVFAGLGLFLTLTFYAGQAWYVSLLLAVIVAPVCGLVELFSKRGADTITVPLSAGALLLPLIYLFSLAGWMTI